MLTVLKKNDKLIKKKIVKAGGRKNVKILFSENKANLFIADSSSSH